MRRSPVKPERLTLLYDGDCPICSREAAWIERRDRAYGTIDLVDIADDEFDAARYGLTHDEVMGRIHGITPDGEIVIGMEAFRRAYGKLGLGWLIAPTGWPILRPLFDRFYRWFARNRMRFTRRWRKDNCRSQGRCGS